MGYGFRSWGTGNLRILTNEHGSRDRRHNTQTSLWSENLQQSAAEASPSAELTSATFPQHSGTSRQTGSQPTRRIAASAAFKAVPREVAGDLTGRLSSRLAS